jgi:hypothetical protein
MYSMYSKSLTGSVASILLINNLDATPQASQRLGHNPLAHFRKEAYRHTPPRSYPAATFTTATQANGNRTVPENEDTIRAQLRLDTFKLSSGLGTRCPPCFDTCESQ